ncbi:MAG: phage baseplate assembly protein [Ruminococcus sp.]|nr:phage baseplate assembly protein [Ruminococcus sp.]
MWLTDYIAKKEQSTAHTGNMSQGSSNSIDFNGSSVFSSVRLAVPYGIAYNPPQNSEGVLLPYDGGRVVIGVTANIDSALEPGEVMLFSHGGASIVLKNDGNVYINGKVVKT